MNKPTYTGEDCELRDINLKDEWDEYTSVTIPKEELERITELWMRSEAEGGWATAMCECCGKIGQAYQEPLPYGTVRLGITHWICSECIRKGKESRDD